MLDDCATRNNLGAHPRVVYLGANDWEHDSWNGRFYPDDMPAEWRLAYYSMHFQCVWLEQAKWTSISMDVAHQWLEDVREGFLFLLEQPQVPDSRHEDLLTILQPIVGMVCTADHNDLLWFWKNEDLQGLADRMRQRNSRGGNAYLLSGDGDIATLERVQTLKELLGM